MEHGAWHSTLEASWQAYRLLQYRKKNQHHHTRAAGDEGDDPDEYNEDEGQSTMMNQNNMANDHSSSVTIFEDENDSSDTNDTKLPATARAAIIDGLKDDDTRDVQSTSSHTLAEALACLGSKHITSSIITSHGNSNSNSNSNHQTSRRQPQNGGSFHEKEHEQEDSPQYTKEDLSHLYETVYNAVMADSDKTTTRSSEPEAARILSRVVVSSISSEAPITDTTATKAAVPAAHNLPVAHAPSDYDTLLDDGDHDQPDDDGEHDSVEAMDSRESHFSDGSLLYQQQQEEEDAEEGTLDMLVEVEPDVPFSSTHLFGGVWEEDLDNNNNNGSDNNNGEEMVEFELDAQQSCCTSELSTPSSYAAATSSSAAMHESYDDDGTDPNRWWFAQQAAATTTSSSSITSSHHHVVSRSSSRPFSIASSLLLGEPEVLQSLSSDELSRLGKMIQDLQRARRQQEEHDGDTHTIEQTERNESAHSIPESLEGIGQEEHDANSFYLSASSYHSSESSHRQSFDEGNRTGLQKVTGDWDETEQSVSLSEGCDLGGTGIVASVSAGRNDLEKGNIPDTTLQSRVNKGLAVPRDSDSTLETQLDTEKTVFQRGNLEGFLVYEKKQQMQTSEPVHQRRRQICMLVSMLIFAVAVAVVVLFFQEEEDAGGESRPDHNSTTSSSVSSSFSPTQAPHTLSLAQPTAKPLQVEAPSPTQAPDVYDVLMPTQTPTSALLLGNREPTEDPMSQLVHFPECIDPPNPNDCSAIPPLLDFCLQKFDDMGFLYTGGNCTAEKHSQDPKYFRCLDYLAGPPPTDVGVNSYIVVTDLKGDFTYFEGWVAVGDEFDLDSKGSGYGANQRVSIYNSSDTSFENTLQVVEFHSWFCSNDILLGDRFGAVQLNSYQLTTQISPGTYFEANGTFHYDFVVANSNSQNLSYNLAALGGYTNFAGSFNFSNQLDGRNLHAGDSALFGSISLQYEFFSDMMYTLMWSLTFEAESGEMCYLADILKLEHVSLYNPTTDAFPSPSPSITPTTAGGSPCHGVTLTLKCSVERLCGKFDMPI